MFRLTESCSLWDMLFPPLTLSDLRIVDASTFHHVRQIERRRAPQVESRAGRAVGMRLVANEGKFTGDGTTMRRVDRQGGENGHSQPQS